MSQGSETVDATDTEAVIPEVTPANPRVLIALAALGGNAALWAVFLWYELLESRAGGTPFCGFGGDCAALWDGPFASTVQAATGLPVAGWGLVWGLVAVALPLVAWMRLEEPWNRATLAATELNAMAGLVGVGLLLTVSYREGGFCTNCALTYGLTIAYGLLALFGLGSPLRSALPRGVAVAAGATALAWLALLTPGMRTPPSNADHGLGAIAGDNTASNDDAARPDVPSVEEFLAAMEPPVLQGISDSLAILVDSPTPTMDSPAPLSIGAPGAPVRFTEWTDILCGHCAQLHVTMEYFKSALPPGSFSVEARHFPLDGNCNAHLDVRGPESIRCLAARAQICVEPTGQGFEYAGALFRQQHGQADTELTEDSIYTLAAPFLDRPSLEACMASPATDARLRADVDDAWKFKPRGTPLVLVNGRQGTQYGPFLFAMALAGGDPNHPAFAQLPEPRAHDGHDHDHEGHNH